MEAGRELDALVAERIMGLQVLPEFLHAKRYPTGDPPCLDSLQDARNEYGLGKHPFFVSPDCGCEDLDKTDPFELGDGGPHPWRDLPRFHGHAALCPEFVPLYSTDIAAAWSVVERMRELGWRLNLDDFCFRYTALFSNSAGDHASAHGSLTAPYAICLAALRAVGVEA